MHNRRILQFIPELDGGGGAQKVMVDLHNLFSTMKYESHLCDFDPQIDNPTNYREKYKTDFHCVGNRTSKNRLRRFLVRCNAFRKIVKDQKSDIVLSHMNGGHLLNLLSFHRAKKILLLHGSILHDGDTKTSEFLLRLLYVFLIFRMADKIVCVSEEIRLELSSKFLISKSRIVTINNFFDSNEIIERSNSPFKLQNEDGRILLCNVGRFSAQKNQEFLLHLISRLKKTSDKKFTLILIGDGKSKKRLVQKANKLNLKVKVQAGPISSLDVKDEDLILTGFMSNPLKLLKKCNFFLLPSLWEGFPLVAGEAMLCNVPLLLADFATGAREMLGFPIKGDRVNSPRETLRGFLLPQALPNNVQLWSDTLNNASYRYDQLSEMIERASSYALSLDQRENGRKWKEIINEN